MRATPTRDPIADRDPPHFGADLFYCPARLMTGDEGEGERGQAVDHGDVGVADAAGRDPDANISWSNRRDR